MAVAVDSAVAADLEAVAVLAAAVVLVAVVAMEAAVDMVVVAIVEAVVEAIMAVEVEAMDTSPPMRCMWSSPSTVAAEEVAIMAAAVEAVATMAAAVEAIKEAAAIMAVAVAADRNGAAAVEEAVAVEVLTPAAVPIATAMVPAEERMPMPRHRLTPMEVAGRVRQVDDSIVAPSRDEFIQSVCVVYFFFFLELNKYLFS